MAVYTTLFSATADELMERFPNVADPLTAPRLVTRVNPFTKQSFQVEDWEPVLDPPRPQQSLHSEDAARPVPPVYTPADDYGRYLDSRVPSRLRSVPHVGTKNVSFLEAEELLSLHSTHPEKYVRCLPDEGVVDVASARLVEILRSYELEELYWEFPNARGEFPFDWLKALVLSPSSSPRYLCAWLAG